MKINASVWFRDILYCKYVFSLLITERSLSCSCHYKYGDVKIQCTSEHIICLAAVLEFIMSHIDPWLYRLYVRNTVNNSTNSRSLYV